MICKPENIIKMFTFLLSMVFLTHTLSQLPQKVNCTAPYFTQAHYNTTCSNLAMSEDSEQIRIQSEAEKEATSDVVVQSSSSDNDAQKEKPTTSDDNNPSTGDKDTDEGKTNDD